MEFGSVNANSDRSQSLEPSVQNPLQVQMTEAQLAAAVENMTEAFFTLDFTGGCQYLNSKAKQLLGLYHTHLIDKTLWEIFQADSHSQLYQHCQRTAIKSLPIEFEEFYPFLNRWFAVRLLPSPGGIFAYFQDITERKETEAALRKEQEFLNVLLDHVQAGIVACDAQGQLKLFNKAARSLHGLSEQPLPPEQWAQQYDLYRADGKTLMSTENIPLYRALQGQFIKDVEMAIVPKQGTARFLIASGQAIYHSDGEKQGAVVVMHDITERKQIETALRESEAQLSSIFQTIPDGIIIVDQNGQIIAANSAAEKILRLTRSHITERVYNDPSWSITTLDGKPFPDEELPFVQVMRTGKAIYGVEHAIAHPDGTTIILSINASPLFDAEGRIINVITAISDITERKQAEAKLRESEQRYRSVIEAAGEGIVLQHADGRIFTCNASAERILGRTAAQMIECSSLDSDWCAIREDGSPFPGEDHPAMVTLRTGQPQSNVTMGLCKPDGTLTWISINTCPLFHGNDTQPFAVVVSFFDISDRKQAEAERTELIWKQVQEQTARLQAEAELQQLSFLADVSTVLASSLDYEQTLQSVAKLAVPYFADWCGVDRLNEDGSISRVAVAHSDPDKVQLAWALAERFPRHLDDGYGISNVMKTGKSEIAIKITDEQLATIPNPEYLEILRGLSLKSCIVAPLQARGRVLGSITFVFSESNRHYKLEDLELAEELARRAAIAIDNAYLYQMAQQAKQAAETAADRTARLQAVTAALSESLTPVQVAEVIVEQSVAALEADAALMALVTNNGTALEIVRVVGYDISSQESYRQFPLDAPVPLAEAVRNREPIWSEPLAQRLARYPHLADAYKSLPFEAWISLPLMIEGKALGGLSLSFKQFKELSQSDREFMLTLGRQCAQAIFRAQLYEAERSARAEAEQANLVKDEFLAVLSHELRSPLNPILGWSKLLQTQKQNSVTLLRGLQTIERNAKLQTQLIEDLLDVSRILREKLSLDIAPVNLQSTIEAAMETVRLAADAKTIQIQTQFEPNVGYVLGDGNRLQQVVWNLVSNAVKFTPQGGQVQISLTQMESQAQIEVSDSGVGIPSEFLPYIFERFRQADSKTTRKFGGLGLGLAIVRHLVELHGGTVQAKSAGEGMGATFTVRFPVMPIPAIEIVETPSVQPALTLNDIQILLVDDDNDTREFVGFVLEEAGATVLTVASAAEALTRFTQSQPHLLLSDIGMPDMDGYMLIRQIRRLPLEQGGNIPAIALTAFAGEMNQQQALAAGFQKHLSKPIEPDELIEVIVDLLRDGKNSNLANNSGVNIAIF